MVYANAAFEALSGDARETLINHRGPARTPWWNEVVLSPVRDAEGRLVHYVGVQTDVSARVEAERVPGLEIALWDARARGEHLVVALCDVDGFGGLDERHGQAIGDAVLAEVAARLRRRVRRSDLIARTGGGRRERGDRGAPRAGRRHLRAGARRRGGDGPRPVRGSGDAGPQVTRTVLEALRPRRRATGARARRTSTLR